MSSAPKNRLSVDEVRRLLDYDPATGVLRWKFRPGNESFNKQFAGVVAGTPKKGYVQIVITIDGRNAYFLGHRLAWAIYYGQWPTSCVDHIDGEPGNNRIFNLRQADVAQNSAHKRELRGATLFKGVYLNSQSGRYGAQIKWRRKHHWLGLFDTPEAAAGAYDAAALRLHGEFAITNAKMGLI